MGEVVAAVTIDTRSIEEVHADLVTKRGQLGRQTEVLQRVETYVREHMEDKHAWLLLAILDERVR